jgi:hypothetical protein
MMATQEVKKIKRVRCPLCGSTDLGSAKVVHNDGSKQEIPVCRACAHWIFPDTHYSYIISGLAKNWACADDLKGVIEDILRSNMPPSDVKDLKVDVAELA